MNDVKKILIVDDQERNIKILTLLCRNMGHEVISAVNGVEAAIMADRELPDLILMDVMMPEMDGFEATTLIKASEKTRHIPVIMVTALDSREDRLAGISAGADDFLTKPVDREELSLRVRNNLRNKEYHDFLENHKRILEKEVARRTAQLRAEYMGTIECLTLVSEYRDEGTGNHIKRIGHYSKEIAGRLGLDPDFVGTIFHAAPMHDVGKVAIPDAILLGSEPLSEQEWAVMKTHAEVGAEILAKPRAKSESPFLQMAVDIALSHHERWDGTGYPHGLRGEEIPLTARIMNIVDQYDALRSKRPYKPAFDHRKTYEIITVGDGRTMPAHFDPEILAVFKKSATVLDDIFKQYSSGAG